MTTALVSSLATAAAVLRSLIALPANASAAPPIARSPMANGSSLSEPACQTGEQHVYLAVMTGPVPF